MREKCDFNELLLRNTMITQIPWQGLHPSNTAKGGVMVKCHTPLKLNTPPDTKNKQPPTLRC